MFYIFNILCNVGWLLSVEWGWMGPSGQIFELGKWIGRSSRGIKITDQYFIKNKQIKLC